MPPPLIVMDDRELIGGSLPHLAYTTAIRALDRQERSLEELRARTGTLLAAASLVASFLGAQTIDRTNSLGTIEALALIALGVSIGLTAMRSANPEPPPAPPAPPPDLGHPETKGGLGPLTR
jgi:hypothetical protein